MKTTEEIIDAINKSGERRIKFDGTVNISTVIAVIILIGTIAKYGNSVVAYLGDIKAKTNVMWYYFIMDHPDAQKLLERMKE